MDKQLVYAKDCFVGNKICGDGKYTRLCCEYLKKRLGLSKILLTTSCTHALEMSALLSDIQQGDEVITTAFTFVSTANAFLIHKGAKIKFVDIRPDTMNIDENLIEEAVTPRTKVIIPVHYGGVSCEMDKIMDIARKYNLTVIEDAAQGIFATYKGKSLGTIGDYGCYSFHETKNYTMGEGGALCINKSNDREKWERAEIIREKGTNRSQFFRGEVDKYSWVDIGSSYLPSDINAALLWAQLEIADRINEKRLYIWNRYYERLQLLEELGLIELLHAPKECQHNAHMFWIKVRNLEERTKLLEYLINNGVQAVFHYVPLHTSRGGGLFSEFVGEDKFTTKESDRLIRLPLFYDLTDAEIDYVFETICHFYAVKI